MALPQNLRVKGSNFPMVEAITLSTVGEASLAMKAIVLAVVGMGITIAVYGTVALIVKADDFGVALASRNRPWSAIGRGIVHTMPLVLSTLRAYPKT